VVDILLSRGVSLLDDTSLGHTIEDTALIKWVGSNRGYNFYEGSDIQIIKQKFGFILDIGVFFEFLCIWRLFEWLHCRIIIINNNVSGTGWFIFWIKYFHLSIFFLWLEQISNAAVILSSWCYRSWIISHGYCCLQFILYIIEQILIDQLSVSSL